MNFKPVNRHLLVEPIAEPEKENSGVLLPEEYCQTPNPFSFCRVLAIANDCSRDILKDNIIVINNSMLEKVTAQENIFYLILENHVMAIASD